MKFEDHIQYIMPLVDQYAFQGSDHFDPDVCSKDNMKVIALVCLLLIRVANQDTLLSLGVLCLPLHIRHMHIVGNKGPLCLLLVHECERTLSTF